MKIDDRDRRKARVVYLRNSGATRKEVAEKLGIGYDTVKSDERTAIEEVMATSVHDYVGKQLTEIQDMKRTVYRQAAEGDPAAIDRVLKLMDREARLLGLDAPQRAHVTVSEGDFSERAASLMRELDMTPPEDAPTVIEHQDTMSIERTAEGDDSGSWVL